MADQISSHYAQDDLSDAFQNALIKSGISLDDVTIDDLSPADEFHIGGRTASIDFLDQLNIESTHQVLDVGCGIGGPARFVADRYDCQVRGIDLTQEYIDTGNDLCRWVGLDQQATLVQGSALDMPFKAAQFDRAYMMHVGMNIEAKASLFAEVARVLKPGALFGVYDVMRVGADELRYPVPWATTDETSFVVPPKAYISSLEQAGFKVQAERDRHQFAMDFFEQMQAAAAKSEGPPALGLQLLMGETAPVKIQNMRHNLRSGMIAPIELIARLD